MSREIDNWKRRMKEEVITKNYLLNGWIHRSKLGYILQYGTRRLEIENSSLSMYKNRHGNIYDSDSYTKCAGTLQLSSIKEITIKIVQMHEIEVKISSQKKIFFLYYCDFKDAERLVRTLIEFLPKIKNNNSNDVLQQYISMKKNNKNNVNNQKCL